MKREYCCSISLEHLVMSVVLLSICALPSLAQTVLYSDDFTLTDPNIGLHDDPNGYYTSPTGPATANTRLQSIDTDAYQAIFDNGGNDEWQLTEINSGSGDGLYFQDLGVGGAGDPRSYYNWATSPHAATILSEGGISISFDVRYSDIADNNTWVGFSFGTNEGTNSWGSLDQRRYDDSDVDFGFRFEGDRIDQKKNGANAGTISYDTNLTNNVTVPAKINLDFNSFAAGAPVNATMHIGSDPNANTYSNSFVWDTANDFSFSLDVSSFLDEDNVWIDNLVISADNSGLTFPNQWAVNGGGSFNDPNNWTDAVVPTIDALFGGSLLVPEGTVTLDSPASLNSVIFTTANRYTLAGPSTLTLTGDARVATTLADESHEISADIAGSAGLEKTGDGTLVLTGAKSYTGTTDVQAGTLDISNLDAVDNQASGVVNIADGARLAVLGDSNGTLAAELTGANGILLVDTSDNPANKVTISRDNSSYGGLTTVRGGTLELSHANGLGTGAPTTSNMTEVLNNEEGGFSAKLALSGGIMVAQETVTLEGRSSSNDTPALTSTGNNFWNGVVYGLAGSNTSNIYIESSTASQTLTIDEVFANDNSTAQTFVFSGPGDVDITTRLSDGELDLNDVANPLASSQANVGVVKRGSGDLTLNYASTNDIDYWFGPTTIEEGRIVVSASGGTDGELRSLDININQGAELNATAFTTYSQQPGQTFRGSGTVNVGAGSTFGLFAHGDLAPGDSVGAVGNLKVTGNSTFNTGLGGGQWTFDIGNATDPNGDRVTVSGGFTTSSSATTVNVSPARGDLDAGSYTIVSHGGGTNAFTPTAQITDANGNPLTARQSVSVNGSTGGQINVVVTGTEASQTWVGGVNNAWDVSGTSNWTGTGSQYFDLDKVTFNDTASSFDVEIDPNSGVHPGSITFANSNDYTVTGGAIRGSGPINVTGTGQVALGNTGNNFTGQTTINANSNLRLASSSTGSITNSGTLALGVEATIDVLVQNGVETIGAGGHKVFAFEAEDWQVQTNNDPNLSAWSNDGTVAGSSGGVALLATELPSNTATSTSGQNFVTYNLKFTEAGSYEWFMHLISVDSNANGVGDDDSFYAPTDDMDSGNTDPTAVGSRIDNSYLAPAGVLNSTGSAGDPNTYTWVRNSTVGSNANEFHTIDVTQADVDAGTIFKFKIATREGGMALDKFVFVADPNFAADPIFGTLTDTNLNDANSVVETQETFIAAGTVLDVNGDLTLADGSTLNLLLGSTSLHDSIDISGLFSVDGTLDVDAGGGGFAASEGDVFDIFDFDPNSVSGAFDAISLPALASGLGWDTSNLLVTGELSVISAALDGDFNLDGSVDGFDFLAWQRGESPNPLSQSDLNDWTNNYGMTNPVSAVPEPTAAVLLFVGFVATGSVRRRRSL